MLLFKGLRGFYMGVFSQCKRELAKQELLVPFPKCEELYSLFAQAWVHCDNKSWYLKRITGYRHEITSKDPRRTLSEIFFPSYTDHVAINLA